MNIWEETVDLPPPCPRCGAPLRPDVVWFGEILPLDVLRQAEAASAACDLFLCIGTSSVVYPAASLSAVARARGAVVVEINPDRTPLSASAGFHLRAPAGQVLPELVGQAFA